MKKKKNAASCSAMLTHDPGRHGMETKTPGEQDRRPSERLTAKLSRAKPRRINVNAKKTGQTLAECGA
jgi:hypothetical protein